MWPYSRHGPGGHWAARDERDFFCGQDDCGNVLAKATLIVEAMAKHPEYEGMLRFQGEEQERFRIQEIDNEYGSVHVYRQWRNPRCP